MTKQDLYYLGIISAGIVGALFYFFDKKSYRIVYWFGVRVNYTYIEIFIVLLSILFLCYAWGAE